MGNDQHAASRLGQILTRRRLLSLSGVGVAGALAGCSGGGDTSGSGTTPAETPGETTMAGTTPTETVSETTEPAETTAPEETTTVDLGAPDNADIVVDGEGRGDFESVQAGLDAIPETSDETVVYVTAGTYEEKLKLTGRSNVTLVGADPEKTILTYDDYADKTDSQGDPLGTAGSASFVIGGQDVTVKDLTIRNTSKANAQAVAARVDASRPVFENCRFVSDIDTLYTRNENTNQYYKDCYIEGEIDFIFGAATAYFEGCEIFCRGFDGYVTAASTEQGEDYGYVFNSCEITAENTSYDTFYLGRPWKPYAQVVFLNTEMDGHIRPKGYDPWDQEDQPDKTKTAYYAEYNNSGPGYTPDERVDWCHILSESEAQPYLSPKTVLDGWDPTARL